MIMNEQRKEENQQKKTVVMESVDLLHILRGLSFFKQKNVKLIELDVVIGYHHRHKYIFFY